LSVGYHDPAQSQLRGRTIDRFLRVAQKTPYTEVLDTEVGMLFPDDLERGQYSSNKAAVRKFFSDSAIIKLWGCNSGIEGWIFSDPLSDPARPNADPIWVYEDAAKADYFYWRSLNIASKPKPSIAQALANNFGKPVFGATSGSHGEAIFKGAWLDNDKFKKTVGRWPAQKDILRLKSDKGDYKKYMPK
jgi:hypothetical protein